MSSASIEPTTPATSVRPQGKCWWCPSPIAWVVLAISLAASIGGWVIARKHSLLEARKGFDEQAGRITAGLTERMQVYENVLHGAGGLYASSYSVERGEWRSYMQSVSIEKRFPGIDAVGYLALVPRAEIDEFVRLTRADKSPGFVVKDTDTTNDLLVVKYMEPEESHGPMIGRNLGGDPVWKEAAERALDTRQAVLSGTMRIQDQGSGSQPGCAMLLPVYHRDTPTNAVDASKTKIEGWVFARFITAELMKRVLAGSDGGLHLTIHDIDFAGQRNLIFDSDPNLTSARPAEEALFVTRVPVRFGDRLWALNFLSKPSFEKQNRRGWSLWLGAAGGFISLLLFGIAWSLSHTRERALAMAAHMTQTLRATNDSLEHERFLLRTLMDNVPEYIYFKDRQSRFLRISRALLRSFGVERPEQVIGKSDFDFFSEEHARQAFEDEQNLIATGSAMTKEEKETWPDGSTTWVLSTKMPLRDESGTIIGTFGLSLDITDRKRAEEAMRRAKDAAEEANRTKSQFLASMSHELRTPLNSVIGFANILLKNKTGDLGPTELNFLDRIQANGKHLLALINEILDLSRIEAGKVELRTSSVALDQLVRETVAEQEGLLREKPVKLLTDLPAKVSPIMTDPEKLKQVIINLIGNALKFTEHGTVTVRIVTDSSNHQPLSVQVVDTGIGIPPDKLGVIFEAFQQAEAGTARKYGGTGLGLTISQALCQLMGYHITVASELGRGSTFTIRLAPAAARVPSPTRRTAGDAQAPDGREHAAGPSSLPPQGRTQNLVLVIDDELDSRTLLTHAIEEFGCRAIAASSGEQGLRLARDLKPQLITLDLMMPGMDGWQVLRSIKDDPALRDIPVIIVSIVAGENRGAIVGAVDVLQKPVTRDALRAVLRRSFTFANPRVLIVDDEEDSRRLLASHLEEEPCEFRAASGGREAIDLMNTFPPDLILLDLVMPGMDGVQFLNHIRSIPRFQYLTVVIVTAKELTLAEREQLRHMTHEIVKKGAAFEVDLKRVLQRFLHDCSMPGSPATKS